MGVSPTFFRSQCLLPQRRNSQTFRFLPGYCCCHWPATTQLLWDCLQWEKVKIKRNKEREKRKEGSEGRRKETRGSFPFCPSSPPLSSDQKERFFWGCCSLCWVHSTEFGSLFSSGWEMREENSKPNQEIHHS